MQIAIRKQTLRQIVILIAFAINCCTSLGKFIDFEAARHYENKKQFKKALKEQCKKYSTDAQNVARDNIRRSLCYDSRLK